MQTIEDNTLKRCKLCEQDIRQNSDITTCWMCKVSAHKNCGLRNVSKSITRILKMHAPMVQYTCRECKLNNADWNVREAALLAREREFQEKYETREKTNREIVEMGTNLSNQFTVFKKKMDEDAITIATQDDEVESQRQEIQQLLREQISLNRIILSLESKSPMQNKAGNHISTQTEKYGVKYKLFSGLTSSTRNLSCNHTSIQTDEQWAKNEMPLEVTSSSTTSNFSLEKIKPAAENGDFDLKIEALRNEIETGLHDTQKMYVNMMNETRRIEQSTAAIANEFINLKKGSLNEHKRQAQNHTRFIKITKLPRGTEDMANLHQHISDTNAWLKDTSPVIEKAYEIHSNGSHYSNVIIRLNNNCSHTEEFVTIKGTRYRCAEFYEVTQCYNCSSFGHFAKNCTRKKSCRKCTGDHFHKECTSHDRECINCTKAGLKSTKHTASYEGCPIRMNYINAKYATRTN